ncbi:MAG: saccharopine dehydrogenase NADP-binding domain-containing protein [Caldilineaceae bacterium]
MKDPFLLYGANGYTGELIARAAVARGLQPILAGRNASAISTLAHELGLEYRVFPLEDGAATRAALGMAPLVLHCAGPFAYTAAPMMEACLRMGVHYCDITGEIAVFQMLFAYDADARASGVMLLPGVGFDVVPTDCLAAHLKRRLPSANHLTMAIHGSGSVSHGTALTLLDGVEQESFGMVRRNGRIVPVPLAWRTRQVDFGRGPQPCISIPWGDVASAYYSTSIPNIEVYFAIPGWSALFFNAPRFTSWLLRRPQLLRYLRRRIEAAAPGPTHEQRTQGTSVIWGRVDDSAGAAAECRLHTPEAYTLTVLTALAIVEHALDGKVRSGFQTPATLLGADFILDIEGVSREDTL